MCEHLFVTNVWTPRSTHRLLKRIWLYDDWNLYAGVYIAWGLSMCVYCIWDRRDLTAYVWRCNMIENSRALHHFLLGRVGTEWGGMTHHRERVDSEPISRGDRTKWRDRVDMVAEQAWAGVGNLIAWRSWTHVYRFRWWALTRQHKEREDRTRWCGLMLASSEFILVTYWLLLFYLMF